MKNKNRFEDKLFKRNINQLTVNYKSLLEKQQPTPLVSMCLINKLKRKLTIKQRLQNANTMQLMLYLQDHLTRNVLDKTSRNLQ